MDARGEQQLLRLVTQNLTTPLKNITQQFNHRWQVRVSERSIQRYLHVGRKFETKRESCCMDRKQTAMEC